MKQDVFSVVGIPEDRRRQIAALAEFIATEDDNMPVNLLEIASQEDITYRFDDYGNFFDGLLEYAPTREDPWRIYLSITRSVTDKTYPRYRFSFAHELGHYFIDDHRRTIEKSSAAIPSFLNGQKDQREREADYFAACLLMPSQPFLAVCHQSPFSYELLQKLSTMFQTSFVATVNRYVELGDTPIMLVHVKDGKIVYPWIPRTFNDDRVIFKEKENVPSNTLAHRFFATGESQDETAVMPVSTWFRYIKGAYPNRDLLFEHCVCLTHSSYNTEYRETYSVLWLQAR